MPTAQKSTYLPYSYPKTISGAMYSGMPQNVLVLYCFNSFANLKFVRVRYPDFFFKIFSEVIAL